MKCLICLSELVVIHTPRAPFYDHVDDDINCISQYPNLNQEKVHFYANNATQLGEYIIITRYLEKFLNDIPL